MSSVEIYPDAEGGWRFRVVAGNNEKVASGESYSTKAGAQEGVLALQRALGLEKEEWGVKSRYTEEYAHEVLGDYDGYVDYDYVIFDDREDALDEIDHLEGLSEKSAPDVQVFEASLVRRWVTEWVEE